MSQTLGETRRVVGRFLLIWLAALLMVGAGLGALYTIEARGREVLIRHREQASVDEALHALDFRLSMPHSDVLYLASQPRLRDFLASGSASDLKVLGADYAAFAASHLQAYDQVRYLDQQGRERVRVNNVAGTPRIVPDEQLQNKVDRYYVHDTLALAPGTVYMSPFDLNVENGRVETPHKPMIRFGTRVVDVAGQPRGMVILNFLGGPMIERLRKISRADGASLWLVNERGDWMLGPSPDEEWGFMFPGRTQATLAWKHPEIWNAVQTGAKSGQIMLAQGLVTHATYWPGETDGVSRSTEPSSTNARWHVVAYVPRATLAAQTDGLARGYWTAFALLGMVLGGGAWGLSLQGMRRRQAEDAIRASEERFRALLESAPDGMVVSDNHGRIVLVNAQTELLFGYSRSELLGMQVEMLMPERFRGAHAGHRASFLQAARAREMGAGRKLLGLRRNGSEFPVSISLNTILTTDGSMVVSDIRDVSVQQAYEARVHALNDELNAQNAALATLNHELEAFSYSVSHDLRAPLRSLDGFSQILLEDHAGQLNEEGRDYLNRIRAATQRMGQLIDDMLTLSRVSRAELHRDDVDMSALAQELLDGLRRSDPDRHVRTDVAPGMVARGDPRLLRIALDNLLGNAWKFTARTPDARIEFGQEPNDGGVAYFVRDNGAGFDMKYAEKLFRAFQRLHAVSDFPGTGIGLAIVQRVVHKHGGRVWAASTERHGATFHFTLLS